MQVSNAQIAIVGDIAGCRLMTYWTCEQQLRQSAVHLRRRIMNLYLLQPATCTTTTKTGEQNSIRGGKSEPELEVDKRS